MQNGLRVQASSINQGSSEGFSRRATSSMMCGPYTTIRDYPKGTRIDNACVSVDLVSRLQVVLEL